jgi:two-component sensor histidine kinase
LVTNAIKHAFPDGRRGHIRVGFEAIGGRARLAVEDDGVGLVGRAQGATGMGQELVRGLAHQLGGELEVQSTKSGTSFRLSIPCDTPTPCAPPPEPSARLLH